MTRCITGRSETTSTRLRTAESAPKAGLVFPDRKLIIVAQNCELYENRRVACRETWIPEARAEGFEVLFYVGTDKCVTGCGGQLFRESMTGDVLTVASHDKYEHQVMKAAAIFRWLAKHRPDWWVFRCDDDTLIRPDLLREFLHSATADYSGFGLGHESLPHHYASGGAGMLLSPRAVELLGDGLTRDSGWDDVEVGRTLGLRGIALKHSERFRPFCNQEPGDNNEPGPENDYITGHTKGARPGTSDGGIGLMRRLWARIKGVEDPIDGAQRFAENFAPHNREVAADIMATVAAARATRATASIATINASELGERASFWGTNSGHWGPALMCLFGLAVARRARSILEIGVWCGGSTRAFLAACQSTGGYLTSIDIDPECRQRVGERPRWGFLCGDSLSELAQLRHSGYRCDLALIDGEHTYEHAAAELAAVEAMLNPGGLIVVDDAWDLYPGVVEAFERFIPTRPATKSLIRYGWDHDTVGGRDKRTFGLIDYRGDN